MKNAEKNSPVTTWDQLDPYLDARTRAEYAWNARKRSYSGLSEYDSDAMGVLDWRSCDSHLAAFRQRSASGWGLLDEDSRQQFALDAEAAHQKWLQGEELKRELRELRLNAGMPVGDNINPEPDLSAQVEAIRESIIDARRSALTGARFGAYDG